MEDDFIIATNENIVTEDFAKKNFFFKGLIYGETHVGKTHLALSSFFMDRGKENYLFIFPTDTVQNIEEVLKKLFTSEQLKRIYAPRDKEGVMKRITSMIEVKKMLNFVKNWVKNNTDKHAIIVVDTADGIEDIFLNAYFSTLKYPTPIPADYGKARTIMLMEFVMPLMDLNADVFFITAEEDVYAHDIADDQSPYIKPTGLTDITLGGSSRKSKDKFKRLFNLIFHLQYKAIYDPDKRTIVNTIEKIKLSDDPKKWFKPIVLTGFDCNDMRRIFKEILFRQRLSREQQLKGEKK